jgi:hypothetical protein
MSNFVQRWTDRIRTEGMNTQEAAAGVALALLIEEARRHPASIDDVLAMQRIVIRLLPDAAPATLEALVPGLLDLPDPNHTIFTTLLTLDPMLAESAVATARQLTDILMLRIARTEAAPAAQALALRADLTASAVIALLARRDPIVDTFLAANDSIHFNALLQTQLVERGRSHAPIAAALLGRCDLSALDKAPLFLHASRAQRGLILLAFVSESVAEMKTTPLLNREYWRNVLVLLRGKARNDAAHILAGALRIDHRSLRPLVNDPYGDGLILLLRAAGLSPDELTALLASAGIEATCPQQRDYLRWINLSVSPTSALDLIGRIVGRGAIQSDSAQTTNETNKTLAKVA